MGFKDLTGLKFNKWTVTGRSIAVVIKGGQTKTHWLCTCECGKTRNVYQSSLTSGKSKSCGCSKKGPYGLCAARSRLATYRNSAKRRGVPFQLTEEQFLSITKLNCFYCGRKPSNVNSRGNYNGEFVYSGIDRINNSEGYTTDNVVPCCKHCNLAKRTLEKDEFLDLARLIAERHPK